MARKTKPSRGKRRAPYFSPDPKVSAAENLADLFQFRAEHSPGKYISLSEAVEIVVARKIDIDDCDDARYARTMYTKSKKFLRDKHRNYMHWSAVEGGYRAFVDDDDRARIRTPVLVRRQKNSAQMVIQEAAEIDRDVLEKDTLDYLEGVLDPMVRHLEKPSFRKLQELPAPRHGLSEGPA